MDKLKIELLADHPEALPTLQALFEAEWAPYYGAEGPGDAEADLKASANRSDLPIALVAILSGEICGTAALKMESVSTYPEYSPWLAALLVAPAHQGHGIGTRLIAAIEELALQHGFSKIYVGAGEKSGLSEAALTKRNWEFINQSDYFVASVKIYRKILA